MGKKRRRKKRIPGLMITTILCLMVIEFTGLLTVVNMLPYYLLGVCVLILLSILLLVYFFTRNTAKKIWFIPGAILALALAAVLVMGNIYIFETYHTLTKISGVNTKTSQIGIYVKAADSAQTVADAKTYVFGALSDLDRENTDGAIVQINKEMNTEIQVKEMQGVMQLVDSLRDGECDAIILNHAYLAVLEEMEGYEEIDSEIREIDMKKVEVVMEAPKKDMGSDEKVQAEDKNVIQIYISGIDTRGNEIINTRSDVNIIATVNMNTGQILLVSTPRDYYVPLSISGGVPDKLTHAGIYGTDVSMDTLGMLYDMQITNYFKVNFAGFIKIIDALGGITINSDYDFDSGNVKGYHFNKGSNPVNGQQALAFARERYAFEEGDRQRGKNQMAVIEGVIHKALSPELLSNYTGILSAVGDCFETNISYDRIAELVRDVLQSGTNWNIVSYSVDGEGAMKKPYSMSASAYVMVPDQATVDQAKELMQKVVAGETISQP